MYQELSNPVDSYKNLQKQLNNEHQRLLRQRQQMLQKQSERLQLYQKLDLVEFFNYSPSQKESKENIKYHLSQKFKNYMRKLTENNVYKRQGYLINSKIGKQPENNPKRQLFGYNYQVSQEKVKENHYERSRSSRSRKSNVQRNSDLGRMFQTMRFYQQQYQSQQNPKYQNHQKPQNIDQSIKKYEYSPNSQSLAHCQSRPFSASNQIYSIPIKSEINLEIKSNKGEYQQQNRRINGITQVKNQFPQTEIALQIQQLRSALVQQQKIYLLSELNHYIKLYKQSQTKRQFLQKHLQNLHEFILEIKQNNYQPSRSKSRSKSKSKYYSRYSTSQKESISSRQKYLENENKMLRNQIQIYVNQLNTINKFANQDFSQINQTNKFNKCLQVKKVDRFKEFAQNIKLMQNQLDNIIVKLNASQSLPKQQFSKYQNQSLINQLQQRIITLQNIIENQELKKQQFFQEVKKFKLQMNNKNQLISTLTNQLSLRQQKIYQLKKQNTRLLNERDKQGQNQKEISDFISRTLKQTPQEQVFDKNQFRFSSVTTNSPSDYFTSRNSRVMNYQEKQTIQQQKLRNSRSRSKYSQRSESKNSHRSKSKTDFYDSFEPKPYERYHKLSQYCTSYKKDQNCDSEMNPLYQRISEIN